MLEDLLFYLQSLSPTFIYASIFLIAYMENVIPPIPGDLPVAFLGSVSVALELSDASCIVWSSLGSILGFITMYIFGKFLINKLYANKNPSNISKFFIKMFSNESISSMHVQFRRYSYGIVLLNRFLPGTRSIISIASGMYGLHIILVTIAATISAVAWNALLYYGGKMLGVAWKNIPEELSSYGLILTACVTILVFISIYIYKYKKKK